MSVDVNVRHSVGRLRLDLDIHVGHGLTALVGPSGSGKTTLLNIIAGLVRPEHAVIRIGDTVLADTAAGIWIPAHRRRIGYVFQEPRVLPHLTVQQNLLLGRWFQRHRTGGPSLEDVSRLLNLDELRHRYPSRLSGGEKQRVALGRALLAHPQLLLLDEPLAAVDQRHRSEILPFLDRLRRDHSLPAIYVTHTLNEVSGRADHVVELGDESASVSADAYFSRSST
jgi:molybdate transport system ATP-binding protein